MKASLGFHGALFLDVTEFQTNFVPCQRVYIMRYFYFEPVSMVVKCDPRHGKNMSYGLTYRSYVVQKESDAALVKIKEKRTAVDYGKKSRLTDAGSACPHIAMAVVEPCNIVLCVHSGLELTVLTVVTDNKAMQGIAGWILVIVRFSHTFMYPLTASLRFDEALQVDVARSQTI